MVLVPEHTLTLAVPRTGVTVRDLDAMPEDPAVRYELVAGTLLVNPAPRQRHQIAVADLGRILDRACPDDLIVVPAPQDVRLGGDTSLQPDLLVVRLSDVDLDDHVAHYPLLVVEVVSPSSELIDLGLKRTLYARMQIPSYWVVHPGEDWVMAFDLHDSVYDLVHRADGDGLLTVQKPFPVSFRPNDLLARFR